MHMRRRMLPGAGFDVSDPRISEIFVVFFIAVLIIVILIILVRVVTLFRFSMSLAATLFAFLQRDYAAAAASAPKQLAHGRTSFWIKTQHTTECGSSFARKQAENRVR